MQRGARRPFQRRRLRYDAGYRLELGYCYDHGIPHGRFLEEWSADDRAKVVAYALEKGERCSSCGTAEWEWDEDRFAYTPVVHTCPGCRVKETLRDDEAVSRAAGSQVVLLPKSVAQPILERQHEASEKRRRRETEDADQ